MCEYNVSHLWTPKKSVIIFGLWADRTVALNYKCVLKAETETVVLTQYNHSHSHFNVDRAEMAQEQNNQDTATIATTVTMNEIQKWMSESTFDAEIRQQIGIFCAGYKTFKQIAKAYPKGSGEFLEELKGNQNDKLIGNQRVAVGILFEKIEQSEQSGTWHKEK